MLRSLFTGISGLAAHQQMLDVTANNIANVNTTGFKSSSTVFQDTLSQTIQGSAAAHGDGGTPATYTSGGTNAQQIGLGVKLAGTEMDMGQGSSQSTGVGTDLMINGDGFFVVQKDGQDLYTRAGAFHIDNQGNLVTPDGALAQGYNVTDDNGTLSDDTGPLDLSALTNPQDSANNPYTDDDGNPMTYISYSIDNTGTVTAVGSDGNPYTLGQVAVATFANPNGLEKVGDTQFRQSAGSGAAQVGKPGDDGHGDLSAGYLEMSNADLSTQLTNLIISELGFQANSKVITTSDEVLQTLVNLKR
jgi:flagellar hook protein FlgE